MLPSLPGNGLNLMPRFPCLLFSSLLSVSNSLYALDRTFIDEAEPPVPSSVQEGAPWREQKTPLPPWPMEEDLIAFSLDAATPFRYFLDGKHLEIGGDQVVRYTLVAISPSGARNVSVEGIRCLPQGVYRVYAYGIGGRFQPLDSDWSPIDSHSDALHKELHGHFLCAPLTFGPRPKKDILRALRGQLLDRENSGFLPD